MINKLDIISLIKIIKLGFEKYPKLYLILFLSLLSVFTEIVAMSLVTSISNDKYFLFESTLSSTDKNILFSIILILFTIRFVSIFFIDKYQVFIARRFQAFLSSESLYKTLLYPLLEVEKKEIGFFIAMGGDETSRASELLNSVLKIFNSFVLFVLYIIMIYYIDSNVFIILAILFLLSSIVVKVILKKSTYLGSLSAVKSREHGSIFIDALNGLKTVKSFGIETFIHNKYKIAVEEYQSINYKIYFLSLLNALFPLITLIILLNIYVILDYFNNNTLSSSYLLSIFFILMRFLLNLGDLLHTINKVVGNIKATSNIIEFISKPIKCKTHKEDIFDIRSILLKSVDFSYDKSKDIFLNLNIEFKYNNSYAIIGKTGSGKSTLIDLMMDFIEPSSGTVLMNNIDTKNLNTKSLKEKVIYISQESIIFNDTIKNNLLMDKKYPDKNIMDVLKLVNLEDMINDFTDGLNHMLNYKGTNISGGQKQRLNIARAILRNPDVLILDESINALDIDTRIKIVKNLLVLYKEKLIIFVTHDKDILNLVDIIIDLDNVEDYCKKTVQIYH
ncbi:MAG: hypothetical protein DRG78_03870 [Epsilonproteobacteria bacterium]|nr:MAG: hypothetical protein DRG78_03870 [Campylobacterota bacterium]